MSTNKAHRANYNRNLRTGLHSRVAPIKKRSVIENPYKATLSYLRPYERFSWRVRVAKENEGARMSKRGREIIELYESYLLRNKYAKKDSYSLSKWLRQYHRNRKDFTHTVKSEVFVWYAQHGNERVSRMRKIHAIVGTENRPILRTE